MMEHTPGPWESMHIQFHDGQHGWQWVVVGPNGEQITGIISADEGESPAANAQLIAAAPALLAACKEALDYLENDPGNWRRPIDQLEDAIALATRKGTQS